MNTKRNLLGLMGAAALTPLLLGTGEGRAAGGSQSHALPNPTLQDHDGRKLKFYDDVVRGKIVIINMMYTVCSGICPGNTANLVRVQEMLGSRVGRDIFMVSLTLRPGFDTPAALQAYRAQYGIQPGWTFLTGQAADVESIRRALGFFDSDPTIDSDISQHTGMLRIGNAARERWVMTPALASPRQIVRTVLEM